MSSNIIMLTISEASDGRFKNITQNALRKWIREGELSAVKVGKKFLINEAVLIEFLTKGNTAAENKEPMNQYGKIRQLS